MKINTCPRGKITQLLKSKVSRLIFIQPLNTQKSYPSHAFSDDRKNLFAWRWCFRIGINLLRFVGYLQPWDKPLNDTFSEIKPIKNEYSTYRRYFFSWMGRKVLILTWRKTLNSFTGFMKVSKGAKIRNRYNQVPHLTQDTNESLISGPKLVIPYEQSNQGITNFFFHDIMFLCALGHMQWTAYVLTIFRTYN